MPLIQNKTINGFGGNVNDKEAGLLTTSFVISFILASLVFGYLGDRYTRKYIMAFGIFLWSGFVLAGSFSVVRYDGDERMKMCINEYKCMMGMNG